MQIPRLIPLSAAGLSFIFPGFAGAQALPTPLAEFTFNQPTYRYSEGANTGSGALSTGSEAIKLGFRNGFGGGPPRGDGQATFTATGTFYTINGGGVSGLDGDYAFQMDTVSGDMGGNSSDNQSAAIADANPEALTGLPAFTVTGWYYIRGNEPLRNFARLISNLGLGGFELRNVDDVPGRLQLRVNDQSAIAPDDRFTEVGEWVFFAVTYDSAAASARFFIGGSAGVEQIGAPVAIAAGPLGAGKRLTIGNAAEGGYRSFSGNFDNIRLYPDALDATDIELVRSLDTTAQVSLPLPPSGLSVTVLSSESAYLEWMDNSDDEDGFRVIRESDSGVTEVELAADTDSYLDDTLAPGTRYTYSVYSFSASGSFDVVSKMSITTPESVMELDPVANLTMTERTSAAITLTWTDRAEGEAGYLIDRYNAANDSWLAEANLPENSTSVELRGLLAGELYRYRVIAFNGDIVSASREIVVQMPPREQALGGNGADEIDESLVTRTINVHPLNGNDANDGSTLALAKRTIASALELAGQYNRQGEGSRILLQPGVYREGTAEADYFVSAMIQLASGMFGEPAMPVIIEGAGWDGDYANGDVIISGSARYTNWTALGDGVYQHSWTINWEAVDPDGAAPDTLRSSHLVNIRRVGDERWQMLYHMTGPDDPNLVNLSDQDGYFWVDQEANWIRVKAPAGVNLSDPQLEVHVNERQRLWHFFQPTGSAGTRLYTPLVLRNLVFRHGMRGAYFQNGSNVIIEDCRFENNKTFGLAYDSPFDRLTVRRCEFFSNGLGGAVNGLSRDGLWEEMWFDGNGRHGYVSNYRGWAEEAIKMSFVTDTTFRDFRISNSWGVGLWLDTGLRNFEVYNGLIEGGITAGVFIENNNPNNIRDLNNQFTVYLRDVWIRDHIPGNAKGIQSSENANAMVDHLFMEQTERPFNFYFNNRGAMREFTVKNSVLVQPANEIFYHQSSIDTWRQIFDSVIPGFNNNRYYGGNAVPFSNRDGQIVDFAGWVYALNHNPANPISGAEASSRHIAGEAGLSAVQPLLGAYPARRIMSEGDAETKAILISRLGADTSAELVVNLRYTSGSGYADSADFSELPDQVAIPAGEQAAYIPLNVLADGAVEGPEILEVQVLASVNFQVLSEPAKIRIEDPDVGDQPLFIVQQLDARIRENIDGPARVRVIREGILSGPVSFDWTALSGADNGEDYLIEPSTLTFGLDDYEHYAYIWPIDDSAQEGLEVASLQLVQTSGEAVVLLAPSVVNVVIIDNDGWIPAAIEQTLLITDEASRSGTFVVSNPTASAADVRIDWPEYRLESLTSADAGGPPSDGFIDIGETGTAQTWSWWFPNDDGFSAAIELPEPFNWFGEEVPRVFAHSNGFITFGDPAARNNRFATPVLLPVGSNSSLPNQLAVAWANLRLDSASSLRTQQVGDVFVIQWDEFLIGSDRATFQLQFGTGDVMTIFYKEFPEAQNIVVGYQNAEKDRGSTVINARPLPGVPYALRLSARPASVSSATVGFNLAAASSREVYYTIQTSALPDGLSTTVVPVDFGMGGDSIQHLPFVLQNLAGPVAALFGPEVQILGDGWIRDLHMGAVYTADWPWIYTPQLGWLAVHESFGGAAWLHAASWDSGWFHFRPEIFPYAYFGGSGNLPGGWAYLQPGNVPIQIYSFGHGWFTILQY